MIIAIWNNPRTRVEYGTHSLGVRRSRTIHTRDTYLIFAPWNAPRTHVEPGSEHAGSKSIMTNDRSKVVLQDDELNEITCQQRPGDRSFTQEAGTHYCKEHLHLSYSVWLSDATRYALTYGDHSTITLVRYPSRRLEAAQFERPAAGLVPKHHKQSSKGPFLSL